MKKVVSLSLLLLVGIIGISRASDEVEDLKSIVNSLQNDVQSLKDDNQFLKETLSHLNEPKSFLERRVNQECISYQLNLTFR